MNNDCFFYVDKEFIVFLIIIDRVFIDSLRDIEFLEFFNLVEKF